MWHIFNCVLSERRIWYNRAGSWWQARGPEPLQQPVQSSGALVDQGGRWVVGWTTGREVALAAVGIGFGTLLGRFIVLYGSRLKGNTVGSPHSAKVSASLYAETVMLQPGFLLVGVCRCWA